MLIKDQYEVLFDEYTDEPLARIRLTSEPWQDIIYYYSKVKFIEEENDAAVLRFDYNVVSPENFDIETFEENKRLEFYNHLGQVLQSLIEEACEKENAIRDNDTEQSDSQ
jgi:hypothetical protein